MNEAAIRDKYSKITRLLIEKGLTISTMESMTGGQIASLLTDTEGASAVLKGAYVTYSNEAKIKNGVSPKTIKKYGVYSMNTAIEMAKACQKAYNADIGIGITGTAGNADENNTDSIPGEVFFSICYGDNVYNFVFRMLILNSRLEYKLYAADKIADELMNILINFI